MCVDHLQRCKTSHVTHFCFAFCHALIFLFSTYFELHCTFLRAFLKLHLMIHAAESPSSNLRTTFRCSSCFPGFYQYAGGRWGILQSAANEDAAIFLCKRTCKGPGPKPMVPLLGAVVRSWGEPETSSQTSGLTVKV